MSVSRRQMLGGAAAALSLAPLPLRAGRRWDADVAIVGGGVAGTYAAWRLAQTRPGFTIGVFEASERIGGRLHSVSFPEAPHLVAEAGGMRFLKAHAHVFRLVSHLSLPFREYPVERDFDRMMLRGRNFPLKDVHSGTARFPYRVPDADQKPDATYFSRAIAGMLPPKTDAAAWRRMRAAYRYRGKLLRDWRNRDLLLTGMSPEELAFAEDTSGYDDWIEGETGLDEMDFNFFPDDETKPFYTVAGGYQRLPLTLADRAAKAGAVIRTGARVTSVRAGDGGFYVSVVEDGRRKTFSAQNVILALPRRGIERIEDFPDAKADARFARLIASVTPIPACKSLLLYERPWWRDHGIPEGRSITDMHARQFYCLGAETTRLPGEDANGYGVLMAYCDMEHVAYWRALAAKPDPSGFTMLAGDSALATEVHREASLVLGATSLRPLAARFQDWSVDPFGGGWHYFAPGHDGAADGEAMLKPMADKNLFVCGEAYSFEQGWVEGALERTEAVLQRHFGLKPPSWLKT